MIKKLALSAASLSVLCGCAPESIKNKEPYNVLFFLVDDLGWSDIGCYGSEFYETPNIDQLGKEGVRFTNAYAACHVSSPTRASIITGRYPASINLTDWLPGRLNFPFQKLLNVPVDQHLPYGIATLPKVLKSNGYKTVIFGKWHLGEDSASTVLQGFDLHVPDDWNKGWPNTGYYSPFGMRELDGGQKSEYLTDRLTDEALKYIDDNSESPFFLYMSHFAVHDPIQGRPDLVEKYRKKLEAKSSEGIPPYILEGNPDSKNTEEVTKHNGFRIFEDQTVYIKQRQDNIQFAAMVESMDGSLGRIIEKLKEKGIDDRTIIIFYSDNGGMSAANFYDPETLIAEDKLDAAFSTSNLPLRAGKGWLYEGGIRVPLIIKLPGKNFKSAVCDVPVTSPDLFPTILDLLGIASPAGTLFDGISIRPLLEGKNTIDRDAIFWHFPHYSNHGMQSPGGAIRSGDYKLLEYFENNTVQLFNLKEDSGEKHDLSSEEPERAKMLLQKLHQWRKSINAKMMAPNPEFTERLK
jgi:arylsulfatase A-like enzyme